MAGLRLFGPEREELLTGHYRRENSHLTMLRSACNRRREQ